MCRRRIHQGPVGTTGARSRVTTVRIATTWWKRGGREWQTVEVLRIADLPAEFNVAGLYWRPLQPPTAEPEVTRPRPANSAPPLDERLGKP